MLEYMISSGIDQVAEHLGQGSIASVLLLHNPRLSDDFLIVLDRHFRIFDRLSAYADLRGQAFFCFGQVLPIEACRSRTFQVLLAPF